jgi:dihydroxyacetone kinase-like protein
VAREDGLAAGLRRALGRVQDLGQVAAGDKSMVDALAPAVAALEAGQGLAAAAAAARAGREATRAMAARRGRARHVEGAGRGHLDPGAVSVHLLLAVLAEERA